MPKPKRNKLGEREIECILIGYAEHNKTYRSYVIEQNDIWSIHSIFETRDANFYDSCFSSMPRSRDLTSSTSEQQLDHIFLEQGGGGQPLNEGEASTSTPPRRSLQTLYALDLCHLYYITLYMLSICDTFIVY